MSDSQFTAVTIIGMVCIMLLAITLVCVGAAKNANDAPTNTPTETTNAPTDAPTDAPTLTEEQARRAGAALMMRAATHAATGF